MQGVGVADAAIPAAKNLENGPEPLPTTPLSVSRRSRKIADIHKSSLFTTVAWTVCFLNSFPLYPPVLPSPDFLLHTHTPSAIFTCSGRRVELEHWMFCHGSPSLPHHRSPPVDPLSWLGLATTATAVFVVDIHGALSYTSYPLVHYLIPLLILVYNTCPTSVYRSKEGLIISPCMQF